MKPRLFIFLIGLLAYLPSAYCNDVTRIRLGIHPDKTRVVLDLTQEAQYTVLKTGSSNHYEVTLHQTKAHKSVLTPQKGKGIIKSCFLSQGRENNLVLKIDTTKSSEIAKIFSLTKKGEQPYRLVLDLKPKNTPLAIKSLNVAQESEIPTPQALPNVKVKKEISKQSDLPDTVEMPIPILKPVKRIVVLDAGHGGQDPGTISPQGIQEKDITLAVALAIKSELEKSDKYKVVLTRNKDEYVPLRKRFAIARENEAHLLISLHADSNSDPNLSGIAFYTLSETASDKEAERLAKKENAADFLSDLRFAVDNEPDVKNILIDLSQNRTQNLSLEFSECIMKKFPKDEVLSKNTHRSADFAVLKAPDVASVLIELGYLSNPRDQKRLANKNYQRKIASRIVTAINDYFEHLKT